jgi:hypothetical protein
MGVQTPDWGKPMIWSKKLKQVGEEKGTRGGVGDGGMWWEEERVY